MLSSGVPGLPSGEHQHLQALSWGGRRVKFFLLILWPECVTVWGPSLQPKELGWDQRCSCHPLDLMCSLCFTSDPPPCCHLSSGKPPHYSALDVNVSFSIHPTSPLCSTGHLAVIFQHLKAIIPKYQRSPNRHLQTLQR